MEIELLSKERLVDICSLPNRNIVIEKIKSNDNNEWLKEYFATENPFDISRLKIPEFELKHDKEHAKDTDLENCITIYKTFSCLPDAQTSDPNIWVSLCFGKCYQYMKYRWPIDKDSTFETHWLNPYGRKRGLFFNGLSRLYWFAKYTYDDSLENPFEITEFCFKDVNRFNELVYRSYQNSKDVRLSIFKGLMKFEKEGHVLNMSHVRHVAKYVSFLGGAYLLDSFTQEELVDKIVKNLRENFTPDGKKKEFKL